MSLMALIKCRECKKDVSDKAAACPHCGRPVPQEMSLLNPLGKDKPQSGVVGCIVFGVVVIVLFFVLKNC